MKFFNQIVILVLFVFFSSMGSLASANSILINPVTLNLRAVSSDIKLENLEVLYSSLCTYEVGLMFPENKNCGAYSVKVPVSENGTVRLPALNKFSGFHGSNSSNYQLSLQLQPKNLNPRDQTYYFNLSTYNDKAIQALENLHDVIYVGHLDDAVFNITAERQEILGGALSRLPNAELLISISVISPKSESIEEPLLSSQFSNNITGLENRQYGNGQNISNLLNAKSIQIHGGNYAFIGQPADAKIAIDVTFLEGSETGDKVIYKKSIESKIDAEVLKNNSNIDLEKVK